MSKVYVVISESIINGQPSHGLHGVYATKSSAINMAISAITSIAKCDNSEIFAYGVDDNVEYEYQREGCEVYVSCIAQEVA